MDFIVGVVIFLAAVVACLVTGHAMAWGLLAGYFCFVIIALRRKIPAGKVFNATVSGMKDSLIVMRVMLLIGILTGMWRMSGTIAFSTYYGIKIIPAKFFVLAAFLISAVISYAIGSCWGVASTVGVILISVGRSGGVNPILAAGAIMSGAYFGDRCSPVASIANLVAAITRTDLFGNVRRMLKTSILPLIICSIFYGTASFFYPLKSPDLQFLEFMRDDFNMTVWLLLPVFITLVLPMMRFDVKLAILLSALCAGIEAAVIQGYSIGDILRCAVFGFHPEGLKTGTIFDGGGLISMIDVFIIMLVSGSFAKIFELTGCLDQVQNAVSGVYRKIDKFTATFAFSVVLVAAFCSQTIAAIMLKTIIEKPYLDDGCSKEEIALDIENSAIVVSSMIPWSLSVAGPMRILQVDARMIPLTLFLFAVPICYRFTKKQIFPNY